MTRGLFLLGIVTVAACWGLPFPASELGSLRQGQGLGMPSWDEGLARTCEVRAGELAKAGLLSHVGPDGGPGLQLIAQGFPSGRYGEVLGAGSDPQEVWNAWLASPPHRRVLLDPQWEAWGVGVAQRGASTIYVVRFRGP